MQMEDIEDKEVVVVDTDSRDLDEYLSLAVPAHDSRDYAFAKHFNLPIIPLICFQRVFTTFRCS